MLIVAQTMRAGEHVFVGRRLNIMRLRHNRPLDGLRTRSPMHRVLALLNRTVNRGLRRV